MILLVANPGPTRAVLLSFLQQEHQQTVVHDTMAKALDSQARFAEYRLIAVDYRLPDGGAAGLMETLRKRRCATPVVVIGAPLRAEAGLLRNGALSVLGAGYSPQSAALQLANLHKLVAQKASLARPRPPKASAHFPFGPTVISPDERLLRSKHSRSKATWVPLTPLQFRLVKTLHGSPGCVLDYEYLLHTVWGRAYRGKTGAIREAISSLRQSFQQAGYDLGDWVTTVHGEGYRYDR